MGWAVMEVVMGATAGLAVMEEVVTMAVTGAEPVAVALAVASAVALGVGVGAAGTGAVAMAAIAGAFAEVKMVEAVEAVEVAAMEVARDTATKAVLTVAAMVVEVVAMAEVVVVGNENVGYDYVACDDARVVVMAMEVVVMAMEVVIMTMEMMAGAAQSVHCPVGVFRQVVVILPVESSLVMAACFARPRHSW